MDKTFYYESFTNIYSLFNLFLDEKRLLTLVPKGQKKNAKQLLKQFDERGSELTWNSGI